MVRVTALISTYQSQQFMRPRLLNLLKSTEPLNLIIIDCNKYNRDYVGSEDLFSKFKNHSIINLSYRISLYAALNIGLKNANTKYVIQANTDDLIHHNYIKLAADALDLGFDMVYSDIILTKGYIDNWDKITESIHEKRVLPSDGFHDGKGIGPSPIWKVKLHEKFGYFYEKLEIYGDAVMWKTFANAKIRWHKIPDFMVSFARRAGDNLESNRIRQNSDVRAILPYKLANRRHRRK